MALKYKNCVGAVLKFSRKNYFDETVHFSKVATLIQHIYSRTLQEFCTGETPFCFILEKFLHCFSNRKRVPKTYRLTVSRSSKSKGVRLTKNSNGRRADCGPFAVSLE